MSQSLVDTLRAAGKATETWTSPDGSAVLVLPYGGRILGLFAPGCEKNFFWTHSALNSIDSACAFYQSTAWHNSGGDRTWLAPEVDFFLPHFPKLDIYMQPREFDPGRYELIRENSCIALKNRCAVQLSRSRQIVALEITKRLAPARNPLRHLAPHLSEQIKYAGYTLHTRLEFASQRAEPAAIGIWSLLQLPHGGELLISTFSKSTPTVYMGHIDESDLAVGEHLIRYRMRANGEHKLGIQAPTLTGRAGYLQAAGLESSLVVRNFTINPSGEYVDVPWTDTECAGSAIEACNVNSNLGAFSELEYHAPAIGGSSGKSNCEDESQLWAFTGPELSIMKIARLLISSDL